MSTAIEQKINKLDFLWNELVTQVDVLQDQQRRTRELLMKKFRAGKLIAYKELEAVSVGDSIDLAAGVKCYRLPTANIREIAFVTEFQAGKILPSHYHDCEEVVQILRGELVDFKTNKTHDHEHYAIYPALKEHELYSPKGTLCIVYFKKQLM